MTYKKAAFITLAVSAVAAAPAHATEVFRLEGIGAVSRGMGGTGAAFDVGPAGMMNNPATLSLMEDGGQLLIGLDNVNTNIDVTNLATGEVASSSTHGSNRGPYFAPEAAFTQRHGPLTLGVGAFALGGLGTEYGRSSFLSDGSSGQPTNLPNSSRLLALDIPLAASFQVNDRLSVGASVDLLWYGLNLDLLLRTEQVGALIADGRVSGSLLPVLGGVPGLDGAHFSLTKNNFLFSQIDGLGIGGRVGMTYRVTPATVLGLSYTFESEVEDLTGRATLTAVSTVAGQIPLAGNIRIRDFQMPAVLTAGISQRLGPITLAVEASRVFWKHAMRDIDVGFTADAGGEIDILLPQNYRDQTVFALGGAYEAGPWTFRAGGRISSQALRSETLFAVIPAIPRNHASLGVSYDLSPRHSIDLAFSHAFKEGMTNSRLPNTADPIRVTHSQSNLSLGFRIRM